MSATKPISRSVRSSKQPTREPGSPSTPSTARPANPKSAPPGRRGPGPQKTQGGTASNKQVIDSAPFERQSHITKHPPPAKSTSKRTSAQQQEHKIDVVVEFLDTLSRLSCLGREAQVSNFVLGQTIQDRLFRGGGWPEHRIDTGSAFEGFPWAVCGDRDVMVNRRSYPVVRVARQKDRETSGGIHTDAEELASSTPHVFAESCSETPAFLKLAIPPQFVQEPEGILSKIFEVADSVHYASSEKFVKVTSGKNREVHGPATKGPTVKGHSQYGDQDIVQCLSCPIWPPPAVAFLRRQRPSGWPPPKLVQQVGSRGCHVVGTGYPDHPDRRLQWRWSFSVAEKMLLHNIPEAVFVAVYLIKVIKQIKEVTEWSGLASGVCSYYVKTASLWVTEKVPSLDNAVSATIEIINWMIKSYETRCLPHYFIEAHNLIAHLPASLCEEMASRLRHVKVNINTLIMASLEWGGLPRTTWERLREPQGIFPATRLRMGAFKYLPSNEASPETLSRIDDIIRDINKGSDLHTKEKRTKITEWLSCDYEIVSQVTWMFLKLEKTDTAILDVPESIVLPLIKELDTLVFTGHTSIFESCLYRNLGDAYLHMYAHFKHSATETPEAAGFINTCLQRIEMYYNKGLRLEYPDGYDDKGISGKTRLALLYHLTGQKEQLRTLINELWPDILRLSISRETVHPVNYLPDISIRTDMPFTQVTWSSDKTLYYNLVQSCGDILVQVNPYSLICYLSCVSFMADRSRIAVSCMEKISEERIYSTRSRMSHIRLLKVIKHL